MDLLSFHPPPPPPRLATPAVVSTFPLLLLPASEPTLAMAAPHILQPVDIEQRQISERRWLELSPSPGSTSSTAASASAGRQPSYAFVAASPPPSLPQPLPSSSDVAEPDPVVTPTRGHAPSRRDGSRRARAGVIASPLGPPHLPPGAPSSPSLTANV
jgi:hypothetical protein